MPIILYAIFDQEFVGGGQYLINSKIFIKIPLDPELYRIGIENSLFNIKIFI